MKLSEPGLGEVDGSDESDGWDTFCFLVMTSNRSLEGFRLSVRSDPSLKIQMLDHVTKDLDLSNYVLSFKFFSEMI